MNPPKVFISYSHDSATHKEWVLSFSTTLRNRGVDAILDQWDLKPGDDLPHFMETQLESCDFALMICTNTYVKKANAGSGGVGYEKMIMTSSMLSKINSNKIIPIIRQNGEALKPTFLKTKLHIDFSNDEDTEYSFDDLLRTLLNAPLFKKPEIGNSPFIPMEDVRSDRITDGIRSVMESFAKAYNKSQYSQIDLSQIIKETNLNRFTLEKYILESVNIGLIKYDGDNIIPNVRITEKGRNYLYDHKIVEE